MKARTLLGLCLLVVLLAVVSLFSSGSSSRDLQLGRSGPGTRQSTNLPTPPNGKVIGVDFDSWLWEVDQVKSQTPVLVIFYSKAAGKSTTRDSAVKVAAKFGSKVKVVEVDCDIAEGALLAIGYGAFDYPAAVALYKDKQFPDQTITGTANLSPADLEHLVDEAIKP